MVESTWCIIIYFSCVFFFIYHDYFNCYYCCCGCRCMLYVYIIIEPQLMSSPSQNSQAFNKRCVWLYDRNWYLQSNIAKIAKQIAHASYKNFSIFDDNQSASKTYVLLCDKKQDRTHILRYQTPKNALLKFTKEQDAYDACMNSLCISMLILRQNTSISCFVMQ